ncbi:MAG: 16S rRNA (uracil(1498)-N(3))-methyltransferase [Moraxella sp.]|nr:16S rRNA (uracil(1498)-N(3))-methyltransferase [Moraxella sp.]
MNRFFINSPLNAGQSLQLSDTVYHHWCKVLRAKIGDTAILFNGTGGEYTATLTDISKQFATVHITDHNLIDRTLPYHITLAQAISKGERMDYTIQKACEMGVSAIQLIISERSDRLRYERDNKKLAHWQGIAIAACEQCGMNIIPQILAPISLVEYVANCTDKLKLVMALGSSNFAPSTPLADTISILVGAEGGLTDDETNLAITHGFAPWTLGERILRTETAGIVAMASLQMLAMMDG